ncbi:MAG: hypothetical protein H8D23_00570 [Candidatus Brocadiales bacterium]|nr:hypothetical protein [Candidatus Brocadiales bacterium]
MFDILKLEKLKNENFDAYIQEMRRPWPNMDEDIEETHAIMYHHQKIDGELRLVQDIQIKGDYVSYQFPKWQKSIFEHFRKKYSDVYGTVIFQKIMHQIVEGEHS